MVIDVHIAGMIEKFSYHRHSDFVIGAGLKSIQLQGLLHAFFACGFFVPASGIGEIVDGTAGESADGSGFVDAAKADDFLEGTEEIWPAAESYIEKDKICGNCNA